jgi:hypothetical protein
VADGRSGTRFKGSPVRIGLPDAGVTLDSALMMCSAASPRVSVRKRAQIARFEQTVTDWEQREYFDLY